MDKQVGCCMDDRRVRRAVWPCVINANINLVEVVLRQHRPLLLVALPDGPDQLTGYTNVDPAAVWAILVEPGASQLDSASAHIVIAFYEIGHALINLFAEIA